DLFRAPEGLLEVPALVRGWRARGVCVQAMQARRVACRLTRRRPARWRDRRRANRPRRSKYQRRRAIPRMTLKDRIAKLEAVVEELSVALERSSPQPKIHSMRHTHRCPSCNGGKLLHFRRVQDVAHNGMVDLALQKNYSMWWGLKLSAGVLE